MQDELDFQFQKIMLEVENNYFYLTKHEKVRVELWTKKLCSVESNSLWRANRNKYADYLLKIIKTGSDLKPPFNKVPLDGPLPNLILVNSNYV